jgi:tetratricopeptide (TPR) repeat protein
MRSLQRAQIALVLVMLIASKALSEPSQPSWVRLMHVHDGRGLSSSRGQSFLSAVDLAEKFGEDDPRLHLALYNAAMAYAVSDPMLAERLFKRDLAVLEKIDGDFPNIVSDCYELANIYAMQRRYAECEAMLARALAIREKWKDLQSDDPFNAELYSSLYMVSYLQGKNSQADDAYAQLQKALNIWHFDKLRGTCLRKVGGNFHNYVNRCKYLTVEEQNHLLRISLALTNESAACYKKIGFDCDYVLQLLDIAAIDLGLSRFADAEQVTKQALSYAENHFDSLGHFAFDALDLLAMAICPKHRYNELQDLQDKYLSQVASAYGRESKRYAHELYRCATIWDDAKRPDLADSQRKQAQLIFSKSSTR